jgi:hypothetical protein
VAVVVQSPARELVFSAAFFTRPAPIFSNLFSSEISLAIVTQSFVINGFSSTLSKITFLHFGHIVVITVLATISIQANIFSLEFSQ